MKKEDFQNSSQTAVFDLREEVAEGKGFLHTFRWELNSDNEAMKNLNELVSVLMLLGKRPPSEVKIILPTPNGRRLDELLRQHRQVKDLYPQQEGFFLILRQLPNEINEILNHMNEAYSDFEELGLQEKMYIYNVLIAKGYSTQEAEQLVEKIYSPLKH